MEKSKLLKLIFVLVFLVSLGANFKYLFLRRSRITVTGEYIASNSNETARFNVYIQDKSPEKATAVKGMDEKNQAIVDAVKEFGIPKEDIKSTSVNVYREQVWNPNTNISEEKDWVASSSLEIKLDDASKASEFAGILSGLEVTSFDGPYFAVDANNNNKEMALEKAFINAKEKATALAAIQNMKLGKVVSFVEGYSMGEIQPMYAKMDRAMGGGGGSIAVEPGSSDTASTVTVTFELVRGL